ncbi:MAG: transposase [Chloroflexi bacterium]|nr:transposase [Chloroflexota bacterium]
MPYARKDMLIWQTGLYYHIYNRGAHQMSIFREPTNYLFVTEKLGHYARKYHLAVLAYCLMPTHYHLLVRQDGAEPAGNLPQYVFNSYTKAYNLKYSHSGTLFEGRFRAKPIQSKSHLLHLCRYIHGNPVKDGLVDDPAAWPYSNYPEWIGERHGTLVDHDFIENQFDGPQEYKKFLFQYLQTRALPDEVRKFLVELEK